MRKLLISTLITLFAAFWLAGCKIRIEVPDGGYVTTESGAITCASGTTCDIDVIDLYFNETFVAKPDSGLYFNGWKKRDRGLFGGSHEPAKVVTSGFAGNPGLLAVLASDEIFYLTPTFSSQCTDNCNVNQLILSEKGSFLFPSRELTWPYSMRSSISANVTGIPAPTSYSIATYELTAMGTDFTIANVVAYDRFGAVSARFEGLREGQIIRAGQKQEFKMVAGLTRGRQASLVFQFTVMETGDRFDVQITFQSN